MKYEFTGIHWNSLEFTGIHWNVENWRFLEKSLATPCKTSFFSYFLIKPKKSEIFYVAQFLIEIFAKKSIFKI